MNTTESQDKDSRSDAPIERLAGKFTLAWKSGNPLPVPQKSELPAEKSQAFDVQHRTLNLWQQAIGGWKVGSKSTDGPILGAPLPLCQIFASSTNIPRTNFAKLGLEVEIAFRFARCFTPQPDPYSDEEVQASIGQMMATIEIVSSRFEHWPEVDPLAQLADLQNHGALIVGEPIAYQPDFEWTSVDVSLTRNGTRLNDGKSVNPAGDPRRLLPWLVNHASARGIEITSDTIITTGSYTGVHFTTNDGLYIGQVDGLPDVSVKLC